MNGHFQRSFVYVVAKDAVIYRPKSLNLSLPKSKDVRMRGCEAPNIFKSVSHAARELATVFSEIFF